MAFKKGLGRGLSSLIPVSEKESFQENKGFLEVPISKIKINPLQMRKGFDPEKLNELAVSIKAHGIIEPLVVAKKKTKDEYELISGERRLRAAQKIGLKMVPVVLREAGRQEKLEISLVENIQRDNLNPIEEAEAYERLSKEFGLTHEQISRKTGKNRTTITNHLRLLKLPKEIQNGLKAGKITAGHAISILSLQSPEKQRALYEKIVREKLSVHAAESVLKEITVRKHSRKIKHKDPEIAAFINQIEGVLGTKVEIKESGSGGKVLIDYYSREELKNICEKIS